MPPRFHAPDVQPGSLSACLPKSEAEHLTRVMRLGAGDVIRVFDGRGHEWDARVAAVVRGDVRVDVLEPVVPAPEPRVRVTLVQAVLKGDKIDDVVRDATMAGVAAIQPLLTSRTDVPPSAFSSPHRLDRWRRIAIASVKQCGRAVVPTVSAPETLDRYLGSDTTASRLVLVEPAANPAGHVTPDDQLRQAGAGGDVHMLVGPEGGWTPGELALARSRGCAPVTLGLRTFRADATPMIALAVLLHVWGDL